MSRARATLVHNPVLARSWLQVPGEADGAEAIRGVGAERVLRRALSRLELLDPDHRFELECAGPGMERRLVRRVAREAGRRLIARPEPLDYERVAEPMRRLAERLDGGSGAALVDRLDRTEVHVAVVAAMSSGKSTLLNAMIGQPLLPAGNRATTAKLTVVRDVDGQSDFEGTALAAEGQVIDRGPVDRARLDAWNSDPKVDRVELTGDLTWIDERRHTRCVLIDTPGPNYAGDHRHRDRLDELLSGSGGQVPDLALFVMDVSRLQARDDMDVLRRLVDSVAESRLPWEELLLFVANRTDEWDEEEDGELRLELARVAGLLHRDMGLEVGGIFPVSALAALLARRSLDSSVTPLSPRDGRAFARLHAELTHPPDGWLARLRWRFAPPARQVWHSSGMPEVHEALRERIEQVGPLLRLHRCLLQLVEAGAVGMPGPAPTDGSTLVACLERAANAAGGVR